MAYTFFSDKDSPNFPPESVSFHHSAVHAWAVLPNSLSEMRTGLNSHQFFKGAVFESMKSENMDVTIGESMEKPCARPIIEAIKALRESRKVSPSLAISVCSQTFPNLWKAILVLAFPWFSVELSSFAMKLSSSRHKKTIWCGAQHVKIRLALRLLSKCEYTKSFPHKYSSSTPI